MPNNELMIWTADVSRWVMWYDYVAESSSYYESKCPDFVKDNPEQFNSWLNQQREKETQKMKSGR